MSEKISTKQFLLNDIMEHSKNEIGILAESFIVVKNRPES